MDTLRSVGGWLLAALSLPTAGVLYYQQRESTHSVTADVTQLANRPTAADSHWFDAVEPDRSGTAHLRGINTVAVVPLVSVDKHWITNQDVLTKAEFKLRQAGIAVTKPGVEGGRPPDAVLYVTVSFMDVAEFDAISVSTIRTSLWRDVVSSSANRLTKAVAVVWSSEKHGYAGKQRRGEQWQAALEGQIEELANARTEANGR